MRTKANLSSRQEALKTRHKLSNRQFQQMLEMLAGLTAAERASLKDPDFITEDEADLIWSDRSVDEPGRRTSLEQLLAEEGIPPRRRRSA